MSSVSPVWHPFTQHALKPHWPTVVRAQGAYVQRADGSQILDAISSWWVITHGHCHPRIITAIQSQAATLDQIIFAEFTHEPAERLAARLIDSSAKTLTRLFFSDSGSTSVEVAIKMALGFWLHSGRPRSRIVVMEYSYHGDTVGAMSVSARGTFTDAYDPLLFHVERIPFPEIGQEAATLDALERLCRLEDTAAFVVEPLVLGAGGMRMYGPSVLRDLYEICREHEVVFIADEVMTGWGRTGTRFACEQADVTPDIVCYSKGLTGGSLPLAVTLCREEIYQAHYSHDRRRTFFHSSSFTANPIACAAALANLEVWEEEPVIERIELVAQWQCQQLARFENDRRFENLRQTGTIVAMDLKAPQAGYFAEVGPRLKAQFDRSHVLLRPLGNTIYVLPPYCVTEKDLQMIYEAIDSAATAVSRSAP